MGFFLKKMKKIVFYEVFDEEERELKKHIPQKWDVYFEKDTIQECGHAVLPASLISIRTQSKIPSDWIRQGLRGVLTRSTGYDHLISLRKQTKTVAIGYLPSYCSRAVAEQAVVMMLSLWRKLPAQMQSFSNFCRDGLTGEEFFGKKVLVVGVGRIGTECVKIASSMGMTVKGVDIDRREKDVVYTGLTAGIRWADAIICAVPLTDRTRRMFDQSLFKKMKKGMLFLNISRGEIAPLEDIRKALDDGFLSGAGLDVFDREALLAEGLRKGKRFKEQRIVEKMKTDYNVILTPHNAFNTRQAVERKSALSVKNIEMFFKTGAFVDEAPFN